ncbi:MAG: DUF3823 domain-containing protein [Bacteroidales bacterium]|nr:DUF3823 domain-containing protein [Bacteroidales bacterium]
MKKFTQIIAVLLSAAAVASCDMFKLDNFDGPNAQVTGRILDAKTGEQMGIESSVSSVWDWSTWSMKTTTIGTMVVVEQGWKKNDGTPAEEDQNWLIRFDGKYTNNLVFAADYVVSMKNLPCYEPERPDFTLKQGANTVDFTVVPFCRIVNPQISYNEATKKIVATFAVELGDANRANSIINVALCANTQLFVGCNYFNLAKDDPGAKKSGFAWGDMVVPAAQPGQTITLEIDTQSDANKELFKYTQDRYVRIAAQAGGNGFNGNSYYNFSKTYKISSDFKTITEAVWD